MGCVSAGIGTVSGGRRYECREIGRVCAAFESVRLYRSYAPPVEAERKGFSGQMVWPIESVSRRDEPWYYGTMDTFV